MTDITPWLRALKFEVATKSRWERHFEGAGAGGYTITVDTGKRTIDYPKPIECRDHTTSNFGQPENFVVLECVCRLLDKGYDPATLILENRYKLGRGASGGKSDITVLRRTDDPDNQAKAAPLLIIECKTWGREHEAERLKTVQDGGQVFGYLQQDRSVKHLCVYSSHITGDDKTTYRSDIIHVEDSKEALDKFSERERAENHAAAREAVPLFKHAGNRESLHNAWQQTYGGAIQNIGIFEEEFTPYAIGYKPLTPNDLLEFNGENGSTKVFNQFTEILRHNNVSDKENAFNRLCAIILAKLIDENRAPDATLDFQWFPDKDTAEDLIDRLQRLYKRGMKETLGEDITYFEEKDIDTAFRAHRRDMAKNEVKKIFRALKFYTNSDFAFKEVHNKKLFEQNAKVVKEIVELFQGYRMKYTSKEAFLGNLFELLLNSGFKQSEGQFFTPIPIARFIVRCLPLRERMEEALRRDKQNIIPRIVDYACGSAHFLTEAIEEIQEDLAALGQPEAKTTTWARNTVWGVEKDYRLARTAKIAMFLHGAGDANILHEDGLAHTNPKLPEAGTVDVLIANPPYAIKDFKQHLQVPNDAYTLLPDIGPNSSEIETLFVERTAQLLRPGGFAGLILPSSILSNAGIYRRTRALLLEKFLLRGIVELGGSTFIATGTNTIILFLERRPDTHYEHFMIRADILFNEGGAPNDADFADSDLLRAYTAAAGLGFNDYCAWRSDPAGEPPKALADTTLFKAYWDEFNALASTKTRKNQTGFRKLSKSAQDAEMHGKYLHHIRDAECRKVVYFALAYTDTFDNGDLVLQRTTVLHNAEDKAKEQAFLGYKWSKRRGAEGMKYRFGDSYDGGALYTPGERDEPPTKAAHYIRTAFLGTEPGNPPENSALHGKIRVAATPAYLDFTRTDCDLAINLSDIQSDTSPAFDSRYDLVTLGKLLTTCESGSRPKGGVGSYTDGVPSLGGEHITKHGAITFSPLKLIPEEFYNHSDKGHVQIGDILLCKDGAQSGKIAIVDHLGEHGKAMINEHVFILRSNERVCLQHFLFSLLFSENGQKILRSKVKGRAIGGINTKNLKSIEIPLPPMSVQRRIVKSIDALEKRAETYVINNIDEQRQQILLDGLK